jgi:hypothetical protein
MKPAPRIPYTASQFKALRAKHIWNHCAIAGIRGAVVFSCGNAANALKIYQGPSFHVITVAPGGDLMPGRWWRQEEIAKAWPQYFDATPGHLPPQLMASIAAELRRTLNARIKPGRTYNVPSGSGETLVAIAQAFPEAGFVAQYNDTNPATTYRQDAPLNRLVAAIAARVEHVRQG